VLAWGLFALAGAAAVLNWAAVEFEWRRLKYISKPIVILALMAWLWLLSGWKGPLAWYGLALTFSLAGDILLLLPASFFLPGLGAFLLGHIAYLAALNQVPPPVNLTSLGLLLIGMGLVGWIYPKIRAGLRAKPGGNRLGPPVLVYSLVLTAMMLSAVLTLLRPEWRRPAAVITALGGILFLISDTVLALDRFTTPLWHGRLLAMVTYHLAQMALVGGAILYFG
jgi:alkenylglycerophosphocholine hydrolase